MNDNKWLPVSEAAQEFGVSERTLQRWIKQDKVVSKLEGGRRLTLASSVSEAGGIVGDVSSAMSEALQEENTDLKTRISELEDQLRQETDRHRHEMAELSEAEKRGTLADELSQDKERLQQQLTEKDRQLESLQIQLQEASQRHDTVVMQMSKMLEYERQPFWRRWVGRKALPAPGDVIDMEADIDKES